MKPLFSIIVPIYEQWHFIPRLIEGLQHQRPETGRFEVLLVDNSSQNFNPPERLPSWAHILTCDTPGSYAARNTGIMAARGRWLVFTDADCVPASNWLDAFERQVTQPQSEHVLFAGAVHVTADGALNAYQIYDMVKGIPQAWYVKRGYGATANLCVPRYVIEQIGPFDDRRFSGGDAELCRRARSCGYRLAYVSDAKIKHPARDSWHALATKARRVKGGQLTAGSTGRRALNFVRSFMPPLISFWRFAREHHQPLRFRVIAIGVQLRVWIVDMSEAVRLVFGLQPERR